MLIRQHKYVTVHLFLLANPLIQTYAHANDDAFKGKAKHVLSGTMKQQWHSRNSLMLLNACLLMHSAKTEQ